MDRRINNLETAAYNFEDFIQYCKEMPEKVKIEYDAMLNAREQFSLNTKADLLAFIGNNGLEDLEYKNTELWRNNKRKNIKIMIDAYKFRSNEKLGYIAFMKVPTGNYMIKSFHLDYEKLTLKDVSYNL